MTWTRRRLGRPSGLRPVGAATAAGLLAAMLGALPAAAQESPDVPLDHGAPATATEPVALRAPDGDLALVTGPVAGGSTPGAADAGIDSDTDPATAGLAHATAWAAGFGAATTADLAVTSVTPLAGGRAAVRVGQTVAGVPVEAGELVVVVAADGGLLTVSGGLTALSAPATWSLPAERARGIALAAAARRADLPRSAFDPGPARRLVFDPSLVARTTDGGRAAWSVVVRGSDRPEAGARVIVGAASGRVLVVEPLAHGLDRVVCDGRNRRQPIQAGVCKASAAARVEGQPPVGPRPTAEVDDAFETLGRTSDFFARLGVDLTRMIGYDVGDGRGRQLRATVRYCPPVDLDDCPMLNAFWLDDDQSRPYEGGVMYIGDGLVGSDDVVAHELSHGVTSATSRLAYYGEPGALNESLSDVFGELVDQTTLDPGEDPAVEAQWLLGEGLSIGAVRSMSDPTRRFLQQPRQPDRMGSPHWWTSRDDDGGVHVNSGVGNKAAYLIAVGGSFGGRDIVGLGLDKTAALYFDVENRLPSGATYAVLGGQLRRACTEMAAAGVAGMTADDCAQVSAAVDATEMTTRRIRAEADRATVLPGERVRIRAQVTDSVRVGALRPHRRATVVLQALAPGATEWATVRTRPVDSAGGVLFRVRPEVSTTYRLQALAIAPWTLAESLPVRVAVVPPITATADARTVAVGGTVRVTGSVGAGAPADQPGLVLLQVRSAGTGWASVAEAVPAADGSFALAWAPADAGPVSLRVLRPADATFARAVSGSIPLTVA